MNLKSRKRSAGFTLVELMVVIATIALLASIAVPAFLRGRKRAQASRVINDLRQIDGAVDQYALENNRTAGSPITTADWTSHLKKSSVLITPDSMFSATPTAPKRSTSPRECPPPPGTRYPTSPGRTSSRPTITSKDDGDHAARETA